MRRMAADGGARWSAGRRLPLLALLILPILYLATLARTPILGDPSEFTTVAHVMGVAHPPGYAFMTVLGKLFQTLVPVGSIAWRMHLLSAAAGTAAALCVFGSVRAVTAAAGIKPLYGRLAALFAALSIGTAADQWQHSIHANPHVLTAAFTAANLFFLTKWWAAQTATPPAEPVEALPNPSNRWLYVFSLSAGLGVTQHPLTVFGFPAYTLFILGVWWQQPAIRRPHSKSLYLARRHWRTVLAMLALALLGLSVWLYFPLRSPAAPLGATGLNSVDGFLTHVLARGLADTLPYYGLADIPNRLLVFWSILRLQYGLVTLFLALLALLLPIATRRRRHTQVTVHYLPLTSYLLTFFSFFCFVIMLRVQDIMAYLLGPLLLIGLLAGLGLAQLLALLDARLRPAPRFMALLATAVFLLGPVLQIVRNAPRISLRGYDEGAAYVAAVFDRFGGRGTGATLLNDWEHQTPLWYAEFVDGQTLDPADADVRWVGAGLATPWLTAVFERLPGGPVYLSSYRREIVDAGFRLRARGPFYQVVEPGAADLPPELAPTAAAGEGIAIVGVGLPETAVRAGAVVPLTLALRAPAGTADYFVPVVTVGDAASPRVLTLSFTTDSHLVTPEWRPGEVIVERFDFALPHDLPGGTYPVRVDLKNLSADRSVPLGLAAGVLLVTPQRYPIRTDRLLANFRQQVGLARAVASGAGNGRVAAPWAAPLTAAPGDTLQLTLTWQSLAPADESYTIFVHLIDLANRPIVALDYTPLGGSMPTHLWFPKWLPGQQARDPYRMQIPPDLPPGEYLIEVGLYEMVGQRRLHISDAAGNYVGDRYILGGVLVQEQ